MNTKIFVNLPVKNLERSKDFFSNLGYNFDAQFTDEKAACLVIDENINAMLLTEDFFKSFTKKEITDTEKASEAIVALSVDRRENVDAIVNKALAAGASTTNGKQDLGFMYSWGFNDLDGHMWEYFYMDPAHVQAGNNK
jgi:uncharacterized protein